MCACAYMNVEFVHAVAAFGPLLLRLPLTRLVDFQFKLAIASQKEKIACLA